MFYECIYSLDGWTWMILLWCLVEIYRYISYIITHRRLKVSQRAPSIDKNLKIMFEDLEKTPELLESHLRDIYYQSVEPEDMNFTDVCEVIFGHIGEDESYKHTIKRVLKKYQLLRRQEGRNVLCGDRRYKMVTKDTEIISWFKILPVYIIIRGFATVIELYMRYLGFRIHMCKSGVRIWYNMYNKKKGIPLVFFHASVGGVSLQFTVMKHYCDNYNVILPEIPGVSFLDTDDKPPDSDQIVDDVHEFIMNHYTDTDMRKIDVDKLKINVMGHSLGSLICNTYVNRYPNHINNIFCIEGQLFFTRCLRIYSDFHIDLRSLPVEDLITVPLFHRDLYVQYFFQTINMANTFLFDMSGEKSHIKIHMYHIKNDRRILIDPQLEYAKRKSIKIAYHLFDGDFCHGAFILNNTVKRYIIDDIQRVYSEQNHHDIDIFKERAEHVNTDNSVNDVVESIL